MKKVSISYKIYYLIYPVNYIVLPNNQQYHNSLVQNSYIWLYSMLFVFLPQFISADTYREGQYKYHLRIMNLHLNIGTSILFVQLRHWQCQYVPLRSFILVEVVLVHFCSRYYISPQHNRLSVSCVRIPTKKTRKTINRRHE